MDRPQRSDKETEEWAETQSRQGRRLAASSLRRNIFANHLPSRRPTSVVPSAASAVPAPAAAASEIDRTGLVVKDENGNYDIHMPALPSKTDADTEMYDDAAKRAAEDKKLDQTLKQQLNERNWAQPGKRPRKRKRTPLDKAENTVPPELVNAVKQSLRRKVAALSEDDWMFETTDNSLR